MTHPPDYDAYANLPRPEVNWDTFDGSWVGIWGYDWADLLAIEVSKIYDKFEHEIWQPDLRADKIYSKEILPGVVHRLFPAHAKYQWVGLKKKVESYSPGMVGFTNINDASNQIFHLGRHLTHPINKALLGYYTRSAFVSSFHGESPMPKSYLTKIQKNFLSKFYYLKLHFQTKRLFQRISCVTYQSQKNLKDIKSYYNGPVQNLTMGINFSQYIALDKNTCRKKWNLPLNRKIIVTICRFNDLKQVDKLIEVLSNIEKDFLFIAVGHGERKYVKYLKNKSEKLLKEKKILFAGYKKGKEKIEFLSAADLFVHVSKSEAGPVVNMEAMATGLPILTTNTGQTAEFLSEHKAGCIVGVNDYKSWQTALDNFLSGHKIHSIDVNLAREQYDWKNIAQRCASVYRQVIKG
jgi:glycosyltransferase involved in cell wall biosynthesis